MRMTTDREATKPHTLKWIPARPMHKSLNQKIFSSEKYLINDNLKSTEKSKIKKKKKTIPDNVSREKSKNKSKSRSTKKVSNSKDEAKNREVRKRKNTKLQA